MYITDLKLSGPYGEMFLSNAVFKVKKELVVSSISQLFCSRTKCTMSHNMHHCLTMNMEKILERRKQTVSPPSVKSLLIHSAIVLRKQQGWLRGWGSIMETGMVAEVVVTGEWPMTAGGQQEPDELRPRKGSVGGPMLLWHVPGNIGSRDK